MTDPVASGPGRTPAPWADEELSLLRVASAVLEQRMRIVRWVLVGAVLAVVSTFFAEPTFTSSASVISLAAGNDMGGPALRSLAQQLGVNVGASSVSNPTARPDFLVELSSSRVILDRLVDDTVEVMRDDLGRVALIDLAAPRTDDVEPLEGDAVERRRRRAAGMLRRWITVRRSPENSSLRVTVTTPWPEVSHSVATRLLEELDRFNFEMLQGQASEERRFVAQRIVEQEAKLVEAERRLGAFLEANRQFRNSPELQFEHDRLQRDVSLQQQVLVTLAQSQEEVRLREVRDLPVLRVIEPPLRPLGRDGVARVQRAALGGIAGGVVAVLLVFLSLAVRPSGAGVHPEVERFMSLLRDSLGPLGRLSFLRSRLPLLLAGIGLMAGSALLADGAAAQVAGQMRQLPPAAARQLAGMDADAIVARLRASGISREQARSRLRALGYDPALVDPYYDQLEGLGTGSAPLAAPSAGFLAVLTRIGVSELADTSLADETMGAGALGAGGSGATMPDLPALDPDRDSIPVFGRAVFTRATSQFDPVVTGPVDAGYRLGPGDQVNLILTGDVEQALTLQVTREGMLVIPDVGQFSVNGLTLADLRTRLFAELGRVYSGVREGDDATTRFTVSLGALRSHLVYVVGEVERPGAYQVSAAATALHALYRAGGPTRRGSFRRVELRRAGRLVGEFDLYDYLALGDASGDLRLEQGDILFVPVAGAQVTVEGEVRRPGRYEVAEGESLDALLDYAGGVRAEAFVRGILIDRILPPEVQQPGRERVLVNVDLLEVREGRMSLALEDGDRVEVPAVQTERRSRVEVRGAVQRPGAYGHVTGMTVGELVARAGGVRPDAVPDNVQVRRPSEEDLTERFFRVSLDAPGSDGRDFVLEDRDRVDVFGRDSLMVADSVMVLGSVRNPGRYPLPLGATAEDMILAAGGFVAGADPLIAEVARVRRARDFADTLADATPVRLRELPYPGLRPVGEPDPALLAAAVAAESLPLVRDDRVFVRPVPGFGEPARISVRGEVARPGEYAIETRNERLSSLVERVGGVSPQAYLPGVRLVRGGLPVAVDVERALASPGGRDDVVLEDEDVLVVPRVDPTVTVRGAVAFESRVRYEPGLSLDDYLERAGGTTTMADRGRVSVEYPSGDRRVVRRRTLWPDRVPEVQPGSVIVVPERDPADTGLDWGDLISRIAATTSSLLTVIVLLRQF